MAWGRKRTVADTTGTVSYSYRDQIPLPVNKNKFDGAAPRLVVQPVNHTTGVQGSTGASTDNLNSFQGNPTAKLTTTGSNVFINFDLGVTTDLSGYEYVDLYLNLDNIAQIAVLQVEFSNYANMADTFRVNSTSSWNDPDENGWRYYRIPIANLAYQPGINPVPVSDWTGIRYFKVTVRSNASTTLNLNIGKVEMAKKTAKAKLFLFYDDGYDNQYTNGYMIAKTNGLKGCIGVITSKVGTVDANTFITWAQLQDMKANGWIVASHTHNHIKMDTVDETTLRADLSASTSALKQNGFLFGARCLVAPNGAYNNTIDKIVKDYFSICRTGSYGIGVHTYEHQTHPRKQRYISPSNTDSVASVQSWIDELVANKMEMCLAWHNIKDTNPLSDQYTYLTSDYTTIIQYIKSKVDAGLLDVVTWHDTLVQADSVWGIDSVGQQFLLRSTSNGDSVVKLY